jgi:nucleotide-binding universal stress UspA family protein
MMVDPTPILEADRAEATEYLDSVAQRLRQKGVTVDRDRPEGAEAEQIVARAAALGVTLIMMTTHGRSGLGRMVFGSVAESVLRHAPCPVLIVRVHDEERAEDEQPDDERHGST